jgi:peptidoglycan/xylan/chitin deacetylase (PgdA/CDA1 family)
MDLYKSTLFRIISILSTTRIKTVNEKVLFLTFDDGPEPDITESILEILRTNNIKATFFCTGENFLKYPDLSRRIMDENHLIANHSFSHIEGLKSKAKSYIEDVNKAKKVLNSNLFRPPWGLLSLYKFYILSKDNKIILWNICSNDNLKVIDINMQLKAMIKKLVPGSIILFHFSKKHAENTLALLPEFIYLSLEKNYKFEVLDQSKI